MQKEPLAHNFISNFQYLIHRNKAVIAPLWDPSPLTLPVSCRWILPAHKNNLCVRPNKPSLNKPNDPTDPDLSCFECTTFAFPICFTLCT